MSKATKSTFNKLAYQLGLRRPASSVVFLCGHTRSRSSVLSSLICQSGEVCGYGESFTSYQGPEDITRTALKTALKLPLKAIRARYLFDKILHNLQTPSSTEYLSNAKYIFLVRNPRESLESELLLTKQDQPTFSRQDAEKYYLNRVERLCAMQDKIPDANKILLLSEQLAESLEEILEAISRFLELRSPWKTAIRCVAG